MPPSRAKHPASFHVFTPPLRIASVFALILYLEMSDKRKGRIHMTNQAYCDVVKHYAVNLADLTHSNRCIDHRMAAMMVASVMGDVVDVNKARVDESVVVLDCSDERARAIIDVIRLKLPKNRLRCYEKTTGRWRRI